jgi:hypothetical protein
MAAANSSGYSVYASCLPGVVLTSTPSRSPNRPANAVALQGAGVHWRGRLTERYGHRFSPRAERRCSWLWRGAKRLGRD